MFFFCCKLFFALFINWEWNFLSLRYLIIYIHFVVNINLKEYFNFKIFLSKYYNWVIMWWRKVKSKNFVLFVILALMPLHYFIISQIFYPLIEIIFLKCMTDKFMLHVYKAVSKGCSILPKVFYWSCLRLCEISIRISLPCLGEKIN